MVSLEETSEGCKLSLLLGGVGELQNILEYVSHGKIGNYFWGKGGVVLKLGKYLILPLNPTLIFV